MSAQTQREHLTNVLRAEHAGVDLEDMGHEICVNAMTEHGRVYTLGYVSSSLVYQAPVEAHRAISRIKFWWPR